MVRTIKQTEDFELLTCAGRYGEGERYIVRFVHTGEVVYDADGTRAEAEAELAFQQRMQTAHDAR